MHSLMMPELLKALKAAGQNAEYEDYSKRYAQAKTKLVPQPGQTSE